MSGSGLPIVGVTAAVQGMASFTANAHTFNQAINNMMRSANLLVRTQANASGSAAAAKNAATVEKAQARLIAVQNEVAAATQRAQERVVAAQTAAAAATVRSQNTVARVTASSTEASRRAFATRDAAYARSSDLAVKLADSHRQTAAAVVAAEKKQIDSANRLTAAVALAARASTPANKAAAATAAKEASKAHLDAVRVAERGAAAADAIRVRRDAALARTSAAQRTANATYIQGQQRVAQATSNAAASQIASSGRVASASSNAARVVASGAARVAGAQGAAASASAASAAGVGLSMVAMSAVAVAALVLVAKAFYDFAKDVIDRSNEYQHALSAMGAISGETGADVARLSAAQLNLAKSTVISVMDLTAMSTEMVKAGLSIDAVEQKALAVGNAMVVASNGELAAARAASLLQVSYAGFGKVAAETAAAQGIAFDQLDILPQAADAITAAVQRSTLTFTGFSDAMRQGGGVAARMGYSIQEFTALVGTMGLTIQSGTEVGTGLRMMFQNLQAPSKAALDVMKKYGISVYDTNGKLRPARDLIGSLSDAFDDGAVRAGKLTQAQRDQALATLFGGRSIKSVSALLNAGTEEYDKMYEAVSRTGTAQESADRILKSTISIWARLANQWSAIKLAFGEGVEPFSNAIAQNFDKIVQAIAPATETAREFGEVVGTVLYNSVSAAGEVITWFGTALRAQITVIIAFGELVFTMASNFVTAAGIIAGEVGRLIQSLVSLYVNVATITIGIGQQIFQWAVGVHDNLVALTGSFGAAADGIAHALIDGIGGAASGAAQIVGGNLNTMGNGFNSFLDGIAGVPASVASAFGQLGGIVGRAFTVVLQNVNAFLDRLAATPLVGDLVTGARAAVGGFVTGFSSAVAANVVAVKKFASIVVDAVNSIQIPNFRNYAAETLAGFKAAQGGVKKPGGVGLEADEPTEPGGYPEEAGKKPKGGGDKAGEKAAKDYASALKKAQEALHDFFDDIDNLWRDHAEKYSDAFAKAEEAIVNSFAEADAEIAKSIQDANEEILKLDIDRAIEADAKARTDALDEQIDEEVEAREYAAETAEIIYQRGVEDFEAAEEKKQDAAERTFDKILEDAERVRDELRAGEDRTFEKGQELREKALDKEQQLREDALDKQQEAETRALETSQDLIEKGLKREQDAREQALKDRLDAEEEALEASQDARMNLLEEELSAEDRARAYQQKLGEINAKDAEERAKAEAEYREEIRIGIKKSIADARLKEKLDTIGAGTAEARGGLESEQSKGAADLAFEAAQQQRVADLRAQFESETVARQAAAEAATLTLREQTEAETFAMQTRFQSEQLAQRAIHETQVTALHEQHERQRDEFSEQLENDRLSRQKDRAREDREFAEEQEEAKRKFIEEETLKQLEASRKAEDIERERKTLLDEIATFLREEDEKKRAALVKQLDLEEYDRRIENINDERDKRIAATEDTLAKQQAAIRKQLDQELIDLDKQLQEKITTIKTQYMDKLEDILEEGGERIKPIVDNIGTQMEDAFGGVKNQVQELIAKLEEAIRKAEDAAKAVNRIPTTPAPRTSGASSPGQPLREGGKPGETQSEVDNFNRNMGGKQYGGIVGGAYGTRQLVMAHGGEYFAGMGGYGTAVAAVRAAESMLQRAGGGTTNNNNSYNYNVNANYGRVQPEGSVRLDLAALVALTSR